MRVLSTFWRYSVILAVLGCEGPDVARLETQTDALTQRVQALETRVKKVEGLAKRAKTAKGVPPGKAKTGKPAPPPPGKAPAKAKQPPGAPGRPPAAPAP